MTVADYTETAFARLPRLHHKDAAEGPSSAGFARRNLVGMMGVMMDGGAKPWSNPYVTDGLVAMWDVGFNSPTSSEWKTVDGNYSFYLRGTSLADDGGLQFAGTTDSYGELDYTSSSAIFGGNGTLECVVKIPNKSSYSGIVIKTPSDCRVGMAFFINNYFDISNNVTGARYDNFVSPLSRYSLSADYSNGTACGFAYNGDKVPKKTGDDDIGGVQTVTTIGNRNGAYPFSGEIYAIRWYSRILTSEEKVMNFAHDAERFGITGNPH